MKKISLSILLLFTLGLTLSACGGGGGGSSAPQGPTSAILTLSTATTSTFPVATTINSYDVTIILPSGVTVTTMPNSSATGTGVVTASGMMASGTIIAGTYTAATGTFPGNVKVFAYSTAGTVAGEFCKVRANVASGSPTASSFKPLTLDDATGINTNTNNTVLGLEGSLILSATAVIQ